MTDRTATTGTAAGSTGGASGAAAWTTRVLVGGAACAPAVFVREPLSFWGGFDTGTGTIIDRWHPQTGLSLAGKLIVMEQGRGSSSGSSVLAEGLRTGRGPAAFVLRHADPVLTVGALVGHALYSVVCPVVVLDDAAFSAVVDRLTTLPDGQCAAALSTEGSLRLGQ